MGHSARNGGREAPGCDRELVEPPGMWRRQQPMPTRSIVDRLRAGDVLLMDGATGSELHRRGVNVSQGAEPGKLGAWSATANVDAPDLVVQVHEDYLRCGADIIISNN